ncbi:MAG TPA: NADH-quinone oxidoreductase subunit L, partial [Vicinamibacterales bacterium]|nr:NADH-quinone oxidoreductase subunit L [Vicinamibacterales bacterium]
MLLLIPLLPFLGFVVNAFFGRRLPKSISGGVACLAMIGAFVVSALSVWNMMQSGQPIEQTVFQWLDSGAHSPPSGQMVLSVPFRLRLDSLSAVMILVVTGIGSLIHIYSTGYMHEESDSEYARYFSYLNLFAAFMLVLVLGSNFPVMFIGWEGVGLCSYLLIGYWFTKKSASDAGKKAFIVNRIGDFAFLVGMFALIAAFGTLNYTELFERAPAALDEPYLLGLTLAGFVALCFFIGATGKSAQIPLYVWLPDAMAGPTPVSALIHAATMVTAGVYMVARSNLIYQHAPGISLLVAVIGALTAIFAATIGLAQTDIKKVLAYSTVSQLGYMFLAAGVGAYTAAIFHVMTHAFFKACLFLGSGSVIHGCGGEQDMRKMGGLRKYMPSTHRTMAIATYAIAGLPIAAGFVSKDEILANAWGYAPILWIIGAVAAGFTAFYMSRLYFMTFWGEYRGAQVEGIETSEPEHGGHHLIPDQRHLDQGDEHSDKAHGHHVHAHAPHESPLSMTGVLWVLAILS